MNFENDYNANEAGSGSFCAPFWLLDGRGNEFGGDSRETPQSENLHQEEAQPVDSDGNNADSAVSRELTQLTQQQRERLFDEIHGVHDKIDEDPVFVETCLAQMDDEIQKVRERSAYNKAMFLAPR